MTPREARLVVSDAAATRLDAAARWLDARGAAAELLVLAPSWEAGDDLVRAAATRAGARFGVHRLTVGALASRLAAPALARAGLAPASGLALDAIAARAVHRVLVGGGLRYFAPVAARPGFPPAVARTLAELRENDVGIDAVARLHDVGADLAALAAAAATERQEARVADRADVLAAALAAADAAPPPAGLPLVLLDLPLATVAEAALVAALARRASSVLATVPRGDARAIARLEAMLNVAVERLEVRGGRSLDALRAHLFEDTTPAQADLDESVAIASCPGEARECVEIARRLQAEASRGVPWDRMAIFLHATEAYAAHLEEALRRASIPAFFVRGTVRPHPAGRALLALLACAADGLSASRFAEYLSLAQVPDPDAPRDPDAAWAPPAVDDLTPPVDAPAPPPLDGPLPHPEDAPVVAGSARAPWRWERLLVDAAVIGGRERWRRRLDGLEAELRSRRLALEDADEARVALTDRQLADLGHLRAVALPLIDKLAALPTRASWGEWLAHLRALAEAALREPEPVTAMLAELEPMAPVDGIDLDEVQLVLRARLHDLVAPAAGRRYGAVFVAPAEAARGLAFDVVCAPGLAEKLFPRKIVEDPILPDTARRALSGAPLVTQRERVATERLALRLAVGAAGERVALSYPRLDVEQARPRVPSFYALEVLRAAEGTLPGFDDLVTRATGAGTRLGWPAPEGPAEAIDEAEYDLALLAPLLDADAAAVAGTATYLLAANPHLARALRARARRWIRRWTPADGLVDPDAAARAVLERHQLAARAFSPTALQHFAACPYRFFLQAIHRLTPRETAEALESLDPLTRGALVHDVQFEVLTALRDAGLLPLTAARPGAAMPLLDAAVARVAARYAERLAPAIPRVWEDAVAAVGADLREWLRRMADDPTGWVPHRFELSFGIVDRDRTYADPASVATPVAIAGGLSLRGSIDLVERHTRGVLRVTDHKTGKARVREGFVVGGGETLQPVLYALACERLLGEPVRAGRLYYCTADGGYVERAVELDAASRAAADRVVETIGRALETGFLPAAPRAGACEWCDYRTVCGPYEEARVKRKPPGRLAELDALRGMP
jgi:RecB family exonuclease